MIEKNGIRVHIVEDYETMGHEAAKMICEIVRENPKSVLGLATGSTPVSMYENLVEQHKKGSVDFENVTTFNLDEYCDIPKESKQSYAHYMYTHFFRHVNVKDDNIHIPEGNSEKAKSICCQYDKCIAASGIDIQVLGIGNNGHIGFNEPNSHFELGTHLVHLDASTIEANARFFDSIDEVPTQAISMGIKNIMSAKRILLLASGQGKAEIIKAMLEGKVTSQIPASILKLHSSVDVIVDKEAAMHLSL